VKKSRPPTLRISSCARIQRTRASITPGT
jgi:hypothetical protein